MSAGKTPSTCPCHVNRTKISLLGYHKTTAILPGKPILVVCMPLHLCHAMVGLSRSGLIEPERPVIASAGLRLMIISRQLSSAQYSLAPKTHDWS